MKERGFDVMSMGVCSQYAVHRRVYWRDWRRMDFDKVLGRRRKPTMMFTAISTVVMMLIMLNIPASTGRYVLGLFFVGLCLNIASPHSQHTVWRFRNTKTLSHCLFYYH